MGGGGGGGGGEGVRNDLILILRTLFSKFMSQLDGLVISHLMNVSMLILAWKTLLPMFPLKCTGLKGSPVFSHLILPSAFASRHKTIPS